MSNLPPLPDGFVLVPETAQQTTMPPPPPGFEMVQDEPHGGVAAGGYDGDINGGFGSTVLGALDGASYGYADEIGAGINAAIDGGLNLLTGREGKSYDQWLAKNRGLQENAQENHGGAYFGGQIAGGIATSAPIAGAGIIGGAARSIPAKLAISAGTGIGTGAVQGFGAGEGGLANRLNEAKNGAAAGAVLGLVAPFAGAAIGKGLNYATDVLASRSGPIGRGAQDVIRRTLENEGQTLDEVGQRARDMGPSAMLADASEGLRLKTEQLAHSDVPSRSGVIDALKDRGAAAGGRINSAYDTALGPRPNVKTELDRMTGEQKTRADALYGQARAENAPVNVSPVLRAIDDQMLTPAERIAGRPDLPSDAVDSALLWVRSHLSNGDVQRTSIDQLDRLERRIRAKARTEFKTGHSDTGSALAGVGRILRDQMKASSPVYKQARETFADDAAVQDAFETGQKLFSTKTHPDFLAAEVADMSEAERQALRLGTRAAVDQAIGSVRNGSLKGRQLLDADWNERKILDVLGEDDGRALINALQGEGAMAETANQVLGNSATARRLDNPFRAEAPTIARVPSGAVHAAFTVAQKGVDKLTAAQRESMARELGPVLTATGSERDRIVQALREAEARRGQAAVANPKYKAIADALIRGGALAYGQNALR